MSEVILKGLCDTVIDSTIHECLDDVVIFVKKHLKLQHPRDDYSELLELNILFPGEQPIRKVIFNKPGSIRRARWMIHLIYAYKIFLF